MTQITLPLLTRALPKNLRHNASQELVDKLNAISSDPEVAEIMKKNYINYTYVLQEGKFDTDEYLNAIKYVSFKLMGLSNKESYIRAFPDKYNNFLARGITEKDQAAYVASYNKGKLVNLILEQTLVPTWVLNQDIYQKAINTQAELMANAKSERVRAMAADSILNHLKKPDAVAPLVNIDMRKDSGIEDMKKALVELAKKQQELIKTGATTKEVIEQDLVIENDN
ncbi:MAG: hypothetical protein IJV29_12215 [Butyrivibrio sp.]|nr:hypothetical protein [Butyrivibrio sp.]